MMSRMQERLYAAIFGYFWLPCPLCGEPFGGHEWEDVDGKSSSIHLADEPVYRGVGICPTCTKAGLGGRTVERSSLHPLAPERWRAPGT